MAEPSNIDLFSEDDGHAALLRHLLLRIASEEKKEVRLQFRWSQGGHGRAIAEFENYQRFIEKAVLSLPALIVVAIDANCASYYQARKEIEGKVSAKFKDRTLIACPEPHIERWYMADPPSFHGVVGSEPKLEKAKCDRSRYKDILSRAVRDGGNPPLLGGIEFAEEIVAAMDFFRAGKAERSLKDFLDQARARLKAL